LGAVLRGIDAAVGAGLGPVKLNTVVVRGENEHEVTDLLLFAVHKGLEIRFIELMPMGPLAGQWEKRYVPESEIRQRLSEVVTTWRPGVGGSAAARRYRVGLPYGRRGAVGFVTAMSCPFCDACNRIRIGADGTYYPCLMDRGAGSVLGALRPVFDGELLDRLLEEGLGHKDREHPPVGDAVMTQIGG
jgi:cyclic pyranopterin phosphate synthase